MSGYKDVLYGVSEHIATITLNRPERLNAITGDMRVSLERAMAEANADSAVRVIVLTGAGRGFCAGADMETLSQHAQSGGATHAAQTDTAPVKFGPGPGPDVSRYFPDRGRFSYFIQTRKPVIAAVNGPAAGLGFVLMLYADLRFASDKAIFTTSFAERGLIAEHGVSWLLPRLVGQANALDLLLSARKITADEARRMQLVNDVFPQDFFMEHVRNYARRLAGAVSPRSLAIMKAQVWGANFQAFDEALAIADEEMRMSLAGPDFKEGMAHFVEKRPARFPDL